MLKNALIEAQLQLIESERCRVHAVVESKHGDTVILFSPALRFDLYARVIYVSGIATKRYVNDLSLHVSPIEGARQKAWYLQYVRILGDKINRGFGSIMLGQLLQIAEREGIAYIEGRMQQTEHSAHAERLRHFYTKFGFAIDGEGRLRWRNEKAAVHSSGMETAIPALRRWLK
ncbi:hypothetical protein [Paenibacillus sacheonensis]|uniref:N-acetyltransferase domain-containing protein n=1 Tax=Paenibacillus sacheonensis TaxID=742054 RepID=A0A7X4YT69_9BACL|nr:hypothetical protein [Paenibacillus sacheonensis]MBM7563625.1 GNAT superfamily N-acetyltransferase [Paenibacillus sacheonensis]NBC71079.1 hypothetical protein [Paenibacillus sacheonensis]